jgi:hypothetical protein
MNACVFRILVGRHPADGVQLALRLCGEEGSGEIILVPVGGESCSLQFGFAVPPDYPGVTGLLRYKRDSLVTEVEWPGGRGQVVFPAGTAGHDVAMAEVLDRLRDRFEGERRVTVFLLLDRCSSDLPPLQEGDSVTCFWEARDHLGADALGRLRALADGIGGGAAKFEGLRLYHRRPSGPAEEARARAIEAEAGVVTGPALRL